MPIPPTSHLRPRSPPSLPPLPVSVSAHAFLECCPLAGMFSPSHTLCSLSPSHTVSVSVTALLKQNRLWAASNRRVDSSAVDAVRCGLSQLEGRWAEGSSALAAVSLWSSRGAWRGVRVGVCLTKILLHLCTLVSGHPSARCVPPHPDPTKHTSYRKPLQPRLTAANAHEIQSAHPDAHIGMPWQWIRPVTQRLILSLTSDMQGLQGRSRCTQRRCRCHAAARRRALPTAWPRAVRSRIDHPRYRRIFQKIIYTPPAALASPDAHLACLVRRQRVPARFTFIFLPLLVFRVLLRVQQRRIHLCFSTV